MKFEIKNSVAVNGVNIREIIVDGVKYITTARLAEIYGTDENNIHKNFSNAKMKNRFVEGVHYLKLEDAHLHDFKRRMETRKNINIFNVFDYLTEIQSVEWYDD